MSVVSYIQAMPKVELLLSLEGAMQRNSLLKIAEANEISASVKHFNDWVSLLEKPDYKRVGDITKMASSWLQIADDLTRVVYDVGVALAKQNVRYAEVSVNPALYDGIGLSFEDLINALNGGRDRARRGWGIEMAWVPNVPREEPRRADDYARAATSVNARKNGIVGIGLSGREEAQPVAQFERAFRTAEKKGVARAVRAGDGLGVEGVVSAIEMLAPNRLIDARGIQESLDTLRLIADQQIAVGFSITRALRAGWINEVGEFPLRQLYDEGVTVFLGSDMPSMYQTSLVDEYTQAVEKGLVSLDELDELALNAVRNSFMTDEDKASMLEQFQSEYIRLRAEHVESGEAV
jgi:adenosine deaminase